MIADNIEIERGIDDDEDGKVVNGNTFDITKPGLSEFVLGQTSKCNEPLPQ